MPDQNSSSQNDFWNLLAKKLTNEATHEELENLHLLLLNNPELHHHADMLTEMWQQSHRNHKRDDCEAPYMRNVMKHKDEFFEVLNSEGINSVETASKERKGFSHSSSKRKNLVVLSIIAFLILTTGIIYSLTKKTSVALLSNQAISSVATKNGSRTKIILPDGSQVWLNAGSNLDYNNSSFNKVLREVTLNGEAYFDVTKNPEKPFIIHTKKMDIKVLGTVFNVRSYSDEKISEAALIQGSIEVTLKDRKDQKIILKPNEKISIANEGPTPAIEEKVIRSGTEPVPIPQIVVKELKANPTSNIIGEIAWTQNKLYFEDESLENIGLRMEKWFGKKVTIANESLKNIHYTGTFENETIEEVLTYLRLSRSFNFRLENDIVVIY